MVRFCMQSCLDAIYIFNMEHLQELIIKITISLTLIGP